MPSRGRRGVALLHDAADVDRAHAILLLGQQEIVARLLVRGIDLEQHHVLGIVFAHDGRAQQRVVFAVHRGRRAARSRSASIPYASRYASASTGWYAYSEGKPWISTSCGSQILRRARNRPARTAGRRLRWARGTRAESPRASPARTAGWRAAAPPFRGRSAPSCRSGCRGGSTASRCGETASARRSAASSSARKRAYFAVRELLVKRCRRWEGIKQECSAAHDLPAVDPDIEFAAHDVDVRRRIPVRAGVRAVGIAERDVDAGNLFVLQNVADHVAHRRCWCRWRIRPRGRCSHRCGSSSRTRLPAPCWRSGPRAGGCPRPRW